jgi:pyruvate/2-oxoglutarate dehydrogenase complex dihydrolipoamide acyltransferase (E2) component
VTVRVFTPFAGRVRKITADIGQTVEKRGSLAEVESPDFGQAQADARKAESDLKLAERNLTRCVNCSRTARRRKRMSRPPKPANHRPSPNRPARFQNRGLWRKRRFAG